MALEVEVHNLPSDPRILCLEPHDGSLNRLFTCKHCFHNLIDQTINYLDISENLGIMFTCPNVLTETRWSNQARSSEIF